GEHASAISWASWAPSSWRYCRPAARFLCSVASRPSAANGCRTREAVRRQAPTAAATRSSGQASGPSASALSGSGARVRAGAGWVPVRTRACKVGRCPSVSRITTLLAGAIVPPPDRGRRKAYGQNTDFLRGGGQVRTVATVNSRPCPAAQLISLQAVAAGDTRSLARQSVRAVHHARGRL